MSSCARRLEISCLNSLLRVQLEIPLSCEDMLPVSLSRHPQNFLAHGPFREHFHAHNCANVQDASVLLENSCNFKPPLWRTDILLA